MYQRFLLAFLLSVGVALPLSLFAQEPPTKPEPRTPQTPQTPQTPPAPRTPEVPPPSASSLPSVDAILEKMIDVAGGREALEKTRSIYGKGTSKIITPLGDRTARVTYFVRKPGHLRMDQDFGGVSFSMAFSPGTGWLRQGSGILTMPKAMLDAVSEEDVRTDLELRYKKEKFQTKLLGEQMIQNKPCYVVEFEDTQKRQTQYAIERKTHLLLRRSYIGLHPLSQMKTEIMSLFGKYQGFPLPGTSLKIQLPMFVESYMGGTKSSTLSFESLEVNSKRVTDRVFRMPNPAD